MDKYSELTFSPSNRPQEDFAQNLASLPMLASAAATVGANVAYFGRHVTLSLDTRQGYPLKL